MSSGRRGDVNSPRYMWKIDIAPMPPMLRPAPVGGGAPAPRGPRYPNSGSRRRRASASIPIWILAQTSSYFART